MVQRDGEFPVFGDKEASTRHGPEQLHLLGPVLTKDWMRYMQGLLPASVILQFFGYPQRALLNEVFVTVSFLACLPCQCITWGT